MIKILFICHGNICRSTMAQSVMQYLVEERNVAEHYEIDSAATSREEIGNGPHYGTVSELKRQSIPVVPHRARQMRMEDYDYYDYIIGMDTANIRNINRIAGGDPENKIYKMMSFTGSSEDVDDPWYTGDFSGVYGQIRAACEQLLNQLES
ncbi:MAG: low molecular weight phosphotyrosine protein phosphatase [Lachnospiraceae bacterium]|nr:low molecular weight phosphotyrosine protein phosphatase [Lachnospiraceae bacterium]